MNQLISECVPLVKMHIDKHDKSMSLQCLFESKCVISCVAQALEVFSASQLCRNLIVSFSTLQLPQKCVVFVVLLS